MDEELGFCSDRRYESQWIISASGELQGGTISFGGRHQECLPQHWYQLFDPVLLFYKILGFWIPRCVNWNWLHSWLTRLVVVVGEFSFLVTSRDNIVHIHTVFFVLGHWCSVISLAKACLQRTQLPWLDSSLEQSPFHGYWAF